MGRIQRTQHNIRYPQHGVFAPTKMLKVKLSCQPTILHCHEMKCVSSVLHSQSALQRQLRDLHLFQLEVELFKTFAPVSLGLPSRCTAVGDDDLHRIQPGHNTDNLSSTTVAFIGPVQFALSGQQKRPQYFSR